MQKKFMKVWKKSPISIKQNYPKQIGNVRVSEDNDVSIQAVVRAVLEEAVYSGLVVKK